MLASNKAAIPEDPSADFSELSLDQISTLHVGHFYKGGDKPSKAGRGGQNTGVYKVAEIVDQTVAGILHSNKMLTRLIASALTTTSIASLGLLLSLYRHAR